MAQSPQGIPIMSSTPPRRRPWYPPPSPTSNVEPSSQGGIITALVLGFMAFVLLFTVVCRCKSRARAAAAAAAAARRLPPPKPRARDDDGDDVQQLNRAYAAGPTAGLPVFTYRSYVKHNMTGGGEEAATCSVCLGALQPGERVRVLPLCMHLYHVECIDPWLDAHSTCPLCRSNTNPTMDIARLPPV